MYLQILHLIPYIDYTLLNTHPMYWMLLFSDSWWTWVSRPCCVLTTRFPKTKQHETISYKLRPISRPIKRFEQNLMERVCFLVLLALHVYRFQIIQFRIIMNCIAKAGYVKTSWKNQIFLECLIKMYLRFNLWFMIQHTYNKIFPCSNCHWFDLT